MMFLQKIERYEVVLRLPDQVRRTITPETTTPTTAIYFSDVSANPVASHPPRPGQP
jgi:hypothetical protein